VGQGRPEDAVTISTSDALEASLAAMRSHLQANATREFIEVLLEVARTVNSEDSFGAFLALLAEHNVQLPWEHSSIDGYLDALARNWADHAQHYRSQDSPWSSFAQLLLNAAQYE
jgi:hypothetical protein